MTRKCRGDVVDPAQVQVFHVLNRTVRRCWLFGDDPLTGINYNHRKGWIEDRLRHFAACFGIDLLSFAILSNHYHLMLRSRPDIVTSWDDTEVARRWLLICPMRKHADGSPCEPTPQELDTIRNCNEKTTEIRSRLSDISWWMRLLDQRIARRCNDEDQAKGRFFEDRFKAIPLIDEQAITACAVYIDLNLIRAHVAKTVELSNHTSGQLRARAFKKNLTKSTDKQTVDEHAIEVNAADAFLSPISTSGDSQTPGLMPSRTGKRCSDKGFLAMKEQAYLELLDWTRSASEEPGRRDITRPPTLSKWGISSPVWLKMATDFSKLFPTMAGMPQHVKRTRSRKRGRPYRLPHATTQLLSRAASQSASGQELHDVVPPEPHSTASFCH